jgi:hypothetical protein
MKKYPFFELFYSDDEVSRIKKSYCKDWLMGTMAKLRVVDAWGIE